MTGTGPPDPAPSGIVWRLAALGVFVPLTALSVGVDAGEIFQILTVEDLEISARAVGIALGLGTLSIPLQIAAARMPLWRARHNMRIFITSIGVMALLTAAIVAFATPDSTTAKTVLVVAVVTEIALSVLYATSWQPLIAYTLSTRQRQFQLGPVRAVTGLTVLGSVVVFGQLDGSGRAVFLASLGLINLALAWSLRVLPPAPEPDPTIDSDHIEAASDPSGLDERPVRMLYVLAGIVGIAGWPLLLTYIARVIWPEANLSVIGAALAIGGVVTTALWRDPGTHLIAVLRLGTGVLMACTVAIALVDDPAASNSAAIVLLAAIVLGAAGRALLRTGVMELTHRLVDTTNSVRVMTMFDAIGSTSHQLGFFVAGFLITASVGSTASVSPFQWFLIVEAIILAVVMILIGRATRPRV